MNRDAKIRFLTDLQRGKIRREDIKPKLAGYGLADFKINIWEEIEPGVFENIDTKYTINAGEDIKCEPGDFNIMVCKFISGEPIPSLASSEREVDLT